MESLFYNLIAVRGLFLFLSNSENKCFLSLWKKFFHFLDIKSSLQLLKDENKYYQMQYLELPCTANISTVLSRILGSFTCTTLIWLHILQPKIAIILKLYSLVSLNVMNTVVACNNHCQITVAHVTQPMTVNWL